PGDGEDDVARRRLPRLGQPSRDRAAAHRHRGRARRRVARARRGARRRRRSCRRMIEPARNATPPAGEVHHADGRGEPDDAATAAVATSPLFNHDLAPVRVADRTWTTYNFAALWISMAHCIPTYMLAAGLIAAGMSWWQALVTILLGNTIVLVPILANS